MLRGDLIAYACVGAVALAPASALAKRVVYINTNPESIVDTAGQDPTMNSYMTTGFTPGPVSGWPALTDDQKQELLYLMKEAAVAFDLEFVLERPMTGTYDMIVMGTSAEETARFPTLGAGCSSVVGLADCDDGNAENIGFFFWECLTAAQQMNITRVAHTIFTGLGFGWGLEQTNAAGEIMGSYSPTSLDFSNACVNVSGSSQCSHVGCAVGTQNATADLNMRIGARVDDGPPVVTITEPFDGAQLGSDFPVRATVEDAFGGLTVSLLVVETMGTPQVDDNDPKWEYEWSLAGVPAGLWTLRVSAEDADGNVVDEDIQVCVGADPCDGGSSSGGDTGGSTSGGGGTTTGATTGDPGTTSGTTGGADDTTTGDVSTTAPPPPTTTTGDLFGDGADTGCACTSGEPARGSLAFLMLAALGLRRRRLTRRG